MPGAYKTDAQQARGPKGKYTSWWKDAAGKKCTKSVAYDKASAEKYARKRQTEENLKAAGLFDSSEASRVAAAVLLITDHIEAYRAYKLGEKLTIDHVDHICSVLTRLFAASKIRTLNDLTTESVQAGLLTIRNARSARTYNHAVATLRAFASWLVDMEKIKELPKGWKRIGTANEAIDRRRVRRALTDDEMARLIAATKTGRTIKLTRRPYGIRPLPGPERALLYLIAQRTGFRANEIRTLKRENLNLDGEFPTIRVSAANEKARRGAEIPISADLAAQIREHVANLPDGWPVFDFAENAARMVRIDLLAAGLEHTTHEGVYDFHSLRGQLATDMARRNVPLVLAQRIMRHSSPDLTANAYTKFNLAEVRQGIDGDKKVDNGAHQPEKTEKDRKRRI